MTNLLFGLEILASLIAILYYKCLKHTYWKWFTIYLIIVFLLDVTIAKDILELPIKKQIIYAYVVIPIQFIFFFWLYAYKSLKRKELFWIFLSAYILSFIPVELYFAKLKVIFSFNYTIGSFC
ncbi:MAG: hypothetical protein HC854_13430 [Flavobacterium sp.]|nr:hypothetical protein [Flavobacterium sp.]